MSRLVLLVTGLVFIAAGARANAQGYVHPQTSPFPRPAMSPFLNLNRGGNSAAINYYGLVRPQQDTMTSLLQLQQMQQYGQGGFGLAGEQGIPVTGHASRFMIYSHYYYNQSGSQGSFGSSRQNQASAGFGGGLGYGGAPGINHR